MNVASVGDVLCFSCAVKSADYRGGYWVTDPQDIMYLESESGFSVALAPGRVRVEYLIAGIGSITSMDVEIRSVNRVRQML
jgi:hypothetical protein